MKKLYLAVGVLILLAGVFFVGRWTAPSPPVKAPEKVVDDEHDIQETANDIYVAKKATLESIRPNLEWAENESLVATRTFVAEINGFFESKVEKAELFSDQALSWTGQWKALSGRDAHIAFLTEKFESYVFSQDELEAAVSKATEKLDKRLREIDAELAGKLNQKLDESKEFDFHIPDLGNKLIGRLSKIDEVFAEQQAIDTGGMVAEKIFSVVVARLSSKVIGAMATRIGISSTVLSTGAATGPVSAGATAVIAILVDRIIIWFTDWITDPKGKITENIAAAITETRRNIVKGDPEAWQVIRNLESVSELHADEKIRKKAADAISPIQRSGNLGLQFEIENYLEVRSKFRKAELEKMVMGDQE